MKITGAALPNSSAAACVALSCARNSVGIRKKIHNIILILILITIPCPTAAAASTNVIIIIMNDLLVRKIRK